MYCCSHTLRQHRRSSAATLPLPFSALPVLPFSAPELQKFELARIIGARISCVNQNFSGRTVISTAVAIERLAGHQIVPGQVLGDSKHVRQWIWQTRSRCSAPRTNAQLDPRFRGGTAIYGRRLALSSEIW